MPSVPSISTASILTPHFPAPSPVDSFYLQSPASSSSSLSPSAVSVRIDSEPSTPTYCSSGANTPDVRWSRSTFVFGPPSKDDPDLDLISSAVTRLETDGRSHSRRRSSLSSMNHHQRAGASAQPSRRSSARRLSQRISHASSLAIQEPRFLPSPSPSSDTDDKHTISAHEHCPAADPQSETESDSAAPATPIDDVITYGSRALVTNAYTVRLRPSDELERSASFHQQSAYENEGRTSTPRDKQRQPQFHQLLSSGSSRAVLAPTSFRHRDLQGMSPPPPTSPAFSTPVLPLPSPHFLPPASPSTSQAARTRSRSIPPPLRPTYHIPSHPGLVTPLTPPPTQPVAPSSPSSPPSKPSPALEQIIAYLPPSPSPSPSRAPAPAPAILLPQQSSPPAHLSVCSTPTRISGSAEGSTNSSALDYVRDVTIELWIDQEGFRAIRPQFVFSRYTSEPLIATSSSSFMSPKVQRTLRSPASLATMTSIAPLLDSAASATSSSMTTRSLESVSSLAELGGTAVFETKEQNVYHFHHAAFDTPPTLRRLTVNDEEKRDYLSRQANLVIRENGTYVLRGNEGRRKLRWEFSYLVSDRKRQGSGTGIMSGEKTFTPLSFSCSPEFLLAERGKKVKLLQVMRKSVTPKLSSSKLRADANLSLTPTPSPQKQSPEPKNNLRPMRSNSSAFARALGKSPQQPPAASPQRMETPQVQMQQSQIPPPAPPPVVIPVQSPPPATTSFTPSALGKTFDAIAASIPIKYRRPRTAPRLNAPAFGFGSPAPVAESPEGGKSKGRGTTSQGIGQTHVRRRSASFSFVGKMQRPSTAGAGGHSSTWPFTGWLSSAHTSRPRTPAPLAPTAVSPSPPSASTTVNAPALKARPSTAQTPSRAAAPPPSAPRVGGKIVTSAEIQAWLAAHPHPPPPPLPTIPDTPLPAPQWKDSVGRAATVTGKSNGNGNVNVNGSGLRPPVAQRPSTASVDGSGPTRWGESNPGLARIRSAMVPPVAAPVLPPTLSRASTATAALPFPTPKRAPSARARSSTVVGLR